MADSPTLARSRLANAHRRGEAPEVIAERKAALAEANIAAAIERSLVAAPPLTDEQCERLAAMLRSVS